MARWRCLASWPGAAVVFGGCLAGAGASAEDLFRIDASATSGPALNVSAGGSDLPDLLEDAVRSQGAFVGFVGRDTQATLDYAGLSNAIVVDVNAAGTSATLQIPGLGFSRGFSGSNRAELEDDIEAFLFEDGEQVYADFLELVRQQTVVDALDGNPTSVTGRLAHGAMRHHTLGPWRSFESAYVARVDEDGSTVEESPGPMFKGPNARGWINVTGTEIDGESFDGQRYAVDTFGEMLGSTVGFTFAGFAAYQELEGSEMFQGGLELGVPIRLLRDHEVIEGVLLEVRAVPMVQLGAAGSVDTGSGGSLWGYGGAITARLMTETLTFSAGVQSLWYEGLGFDAEYDGQGYSFDTELDQHVLSAGGSVGWRPVEWLMLDAGYAYHDYREPAGVSYWGSPSAGASAVLGGATLRVGYEADLAERVDTQSLSFGLHVEF